MTRSRQAWEAFLAPATETDEVYESASRWLGARLEGYVQSRPDAPVSLAVPDRFLEILGDATETAAAVARDGSRTATQRERPVR
ncbi:MAG: hypothetical protein M3Z20_15620 [Chloroflexota bacterium]|nr:hypothetical protein [Chloroflexota bacterium]